MNYEVIWESEDEESDLISVKDSEGEPMYLLNGNQVACEELTELMLAIARLGLT